MHAALTMSDDVLNAASPALAETMSNVMSSSGLVLPLASVGSGPVAPAWLIVPLAILAMLVIAAHVLLLPKVEMPDSRRRIRTANGMLMLFTTPIFAYALSIANPAVDQRAFVLSWMMVAGLLVIILLVAMFDMANTFRLHRIHLRELRGKLRGPRDEHDSDSQHEARGESA